MITYKFRIYPKSSQITTLNQWLEECRMLYNNFLSERKNAWENEKKNVHLYDQLGRLPKLKKEFPKLAKVYSQVLQNVGIRVDLAYQAFFRRCKTGEKPGYPRFKSFGRYDSFCYPISESIKIGDDFIHLPKFGKLKMVKHRNIEGTIKTVTLKKNLNNEFYVSIVTDHKRVKNFVDTKRSVGVDVGILNFATLSDGSVIENPRFFERKQKQLARKQRKQSKLGSKHHKYKKTKRAVCKIHKKIRNSRHDFAHKTTNKLIQQYNTICIEDININSMIKKKWCSKQISDASWGTFMRILEYKAEWAGRKLVKVNPAYTSQTCSKCGARTLHELKDRVFNCSCGHTENRDLNASRNILTLGLQGLCKG